MNHFSFDSLSAITNDRVFAIPDYQRDYSWGSVQVDTLLDDIEGLYYAYITNRDSKHFCGPIVTIPYDPDLSSCTKKVFASRSLENKTKVNVIDGQQRLTTIALFLMAIRDLAKEKGLAEINELRGQIDTDLLDEEDVLIPVLNHSNENTGNCFKSLLYGDSSSFPYDARRSGAKKIRASYQRCREKVEEILDNDKSADQRQVLKTLFEQVKYRLQFVGIDCAEEGDAFQIFESLNSTGLSLTPAEQVKNLILMKSKSVDKSLSQWEGIVDNVGEDDIVDFLSHYLFAKLGSRVGRAEVYTQFKVMLATSTASSVLSGLSDYSVVYAELKNPSAANKAANQLRDFSDLGQKQAYVPLLASGMRFGVKSDCFAKIADSILVFIVRHMVCKQRSNILDAVFGDALTIINDESKDENEIIAHFKERQMSDKDFRQSFEQLSFDYTAKPQREARTYLRRIEEHMRGDNMPLKIPRENLTVEHIIPKQPSADDMDEWISDEDRAKGISLDTFDDDYVKSVGNLALLFRPENSSAGNGGYQSKVVVYSSEMLGKDGTRAIPAEVFMLIKELIEEYQAFNSSSVPDRSAALAEKAVKAWA